MTMDQKQIAILGWLAEGSGARWLGDMPNHIHLLAGDETLLILGDFDDERLVYRHERTTGIQSYRIEWEISGLGRAVLETEREKPSKPEHQAPASLAKVPEGWALVPIEATREQVEALMNQTAIALSRNAEDLIKTLYRVAIQAAPVPK